ncbi:hypothetical protein ACQKWADRAFT_124514 [Trichoderma austrokoningii]
MASVEQAQEIVRRLTRKYGYLDEGMMSDIEKWKPEYRREIDENWLAMENTAAQSIKTLAKQIYGSGARFVFELLQNAEDNNFSKTAEDPYISFKVYKNRIVVECNEDGFNERDLGAICAVGQSTKSSSYGYIGAKGIGFKSVFIAAWKVHIQSGNFSFEFRHKRDDPGLGMVRPIWVPTDERLEGPLTRMTLYFHDEGDPDELQRLKSIIFKQLDDLQQTSLLFLKKLQRVKIVFHGNDGRIKTSKEFLKHQVDKYRVALYTKSSTKGHKATKKSQIYHITTLKAHGIARSDNRDISNKDEVETSSTTAEVVLAFPLTAEFQPLVNTKKKQEIFAFLPVRESDYKFLIHSDFDTSANRQDIIITSRRNENLLDWIAQAFLNAIKQFCEHSSLCYEWPLFLPNTAGASESFWASLNSKIQTLVMASPILKSRHRQELRVITDVFCLTKDATYGDGKPILDDPIRDPFISPKYSGPPMVILMSYGLQTFSVNHFLALMEKDLGSPYPTLQGVMMNEDWHSALANFLCSWFDSNIRKADRLRTLPIIPLRDGKWTSAKMGPVYLPMTKGVVIPENLNMRVIHPAATSNTARQRLFKHLGVSEADVVTVRAAVLRECTTLGLFGVSIVHSKPYLHYLYVTHQPEMSAKTELQQIVVKNDQEISRRPHETDVYLPGKTHPFSPESLLVPNGAAPGFSIDYVHATYMENIPEKPTQDHPSWEKWLFDFVGIRERLRLVNHNGESLSEPVLYVHEHLPEKFLGLLKYLWRSASSSVKRNEILRRNIKALSARRLCRVSDDILLGGTWLPFKNLCDHVSLYMEFPEHFPFLKIDNKSSDDKFSLEWSFLAECFEVGKKENLVFYMDILRYIQKSYPDAADVSVSQGQKIFDLYSAIYAKLTLSRNQAVDQNTIKNFFAEDKIYVPGDGDSVWAPSSECLWLAPPDMISKSSLRSLYLRILGEDQLENIERFFQRIVEIPSASLPDIVAELEMLRDMDCFGFERINPLYEYLAELSLPKASLRGAFGAKQLIYAKSRGEWRWCKISDCLWSSTVEIRGKVTLDSDYEPLKNFFVEMLGVTSLTLEMLYDELKQTSPQSDINDIKVTLISFSSRLQNSSTPLDPQPILDANIFPVRYSNGEVVLRSAKVDFAIPDRDHLSTKFKEKIAMLDFELEDIHRLKPFFEWTKLHGRYLSSCVEEGTSVSDNGRPISKESRDLKLKAYYILRLAATFSSPRYLADPSGFYQLLRTMKTMETHRISSILTVSQNNEKVFVEDVVGSEHIEHTSSGLTIYVPQKRRAQEICFCSALPEKLAKWIMTDPVTNISATVGSEIASTLAIIFTCNRSTLGEICNRHGIIQIELSNKDIEDEDEEEEDDSYLEEEEDQIQQQPHGQNQEQRHGQSPQTDKLALSEETSSEQQPTSSHSSTNTSLSLMSERLIETVIRRSHLASHSPQAEQGQENMPSYRQRPVEHLGYPSSPDLNVVSVENRENLASAGPFDETQYGVLLERVVAAAQSATFPARGSSGTIDLIAFLPDQLRGGTYESFERLGMITRVGSAYQLERDKKVGAAGELFVFELLSTLQLPRWSNENWQSTIRGYVRAHPSYHNLANWRGRETADLVYDDTEGQFTNTLIGCGYLNHDQWNNARPKYYIEVKTTTGSRETPFYMSNSQYERMRRTHATPNCSEIYMVLRVFWLNSDNIGMCVYTDPEQLRQDGRLLFTAQTWSVTPNMESEE